MIYIVTALSVCLIIVALTMKKEDISPDEEIVTESTPETISVEEAYELVCRNEIFQHGCGHKFTSRYQFEFAFANLTFKSRSRFTTPVE